MDVATHASPEPTYQVVCYRCQYEGTAQGTRPRQTGCPQCDFPLITATDMSPPAALLHLGSPGRRLPGVDAAIPALTGGSRRLSLALPPPSPSVEPEPQSWSRWSSIALCGFAIALGVAAKAVQGVL